MSTGWITFGTAGRQWALPLTSVVEVVRCRTLEPLPGAEPPLAGTLTLRGRPLAVLDARSDDDGAQRLRGDGSRGDVLVLAAVDGSLHGVAVDRVNGVLGADALEPAQDGAGLGDAVVEVRHGPSGAVLVADAARLATAVRRRRPLAAPVV